MTDWTRCVVLVTGAGVKSHASGFVVERDDVRALVVTCDHVIADLGGELRVNGRPAHVAWRGLDIGVDLAVLEVDGLMVDALPIGGGLAPGAAIVVLGWRKVEKGQSAEASNGTVEKRAQLTYEIACPHSGYRLALAEPLPQGASGGPVIDTATGAVSAVVSLRAPGAEAYATAIGALGHWRELPAPMVGAAPTPPVATEPGIDIFVIHADNANDTAFVRNELLPALGLPPERVLLSSALPLGKTIVGALEDGATTSRVVVAVVSPAFLANKWAIFGETLAQQVAVTGGILVPLLLVDCQVPLRLQARTALDCRIYQDRPAEFDRLRRLLPGSQMASRVLPTTLRWVLVAGSGREPLPPRLAITAEQLGRGLARASFGLITGGWPGVDATVARAYAEALDGAVPLAERILQILDRRNTPAFPGGGWLPCASDDEAWHLSVFRANAVVLIGGLGGTKRTAQLARKLGKPVLPLADTNEANHNDARETYFEMVRDWATSPVPSLKLDDFVQLASPAPRVVDHVINVLRGLAPAESQLDAEV